MIMIVKKGMGNAEDGLIDGSDQVAQQAAQGYWQTGTRFVQSYRDPSQTPAVGLLPAGILAYGLINKSRTAIVVGGIWSGLNLLSWLGRQNVVGGGTPINVN